MTRRCLSAAILTAALLSAGCDAPSAPSPSIPRAHGPSSTQGTASSGASPAPSLSTSALAASSPPFRSDSAVSLWIASGEVIDGDGIRRRADVVVNEGVILHVGEVDAKLVAKKKIDARGAVVTPGFIDLHSHAAAQGSVENALAMGVTTVVIGQDGVSSADIGSFLATASGKRVNIATLYGHAMARAEAKIGAKEPSPKALLALEAAVDRAMRAGAFGVSTGLEYDPGKLAKAEELAALARPVGRHGGVVMSHLRTEDDDAIDDAIDELFLQCKASGARPHIAHFKVVLGRGIPRAEALLARIEKARVEGLEVSADMYPYSASYTSLSILFPDFARPPHAYRTAVEKRRPELAAFVKARVEARNGPKATLFGTGKYAGKTLEEAAAAAGRPYEDLLIELGPNGAEAAYFVMNEALQARLFQADFVAVGSDGGAGSAHPRAYGSFARVLELWVRKEAVVSLESAVRKMTGLAAHVLRLDGERGCVRAGCAADLLVFDPGEVRSPATFERPQRLAEGFRHVIVNGVVVREFGKANQATPGRALRSKQASAEASKP